VIECVATLKALVLNVATPLPLSVPEPICVAPSKKFTVPPGVPPDEVTVAVKVTDWPNVEGFGLEVNAVEVEAGLTTWDTALDVLAAKSVLAT
jgi:hypothetical protein